MTAQLAYSLVWAAALLGAVAMICLAGLKAWRGWLELRRHEIDAARDALPEPEPGARIGMADVGERLRKLEAIARGVDL
jgi:hypothetical protein